ncbi:MAG TPA: hypothetical protein VJU84_16585 [Pyrinomonadaceae bacterium]|nr:hypothetical protein [Pyrinomonadaceae bacterium]
MNSRTKKLTIFSSLILTLLICGGTINAQQLFPIFGPEKFERTTAAPQEVIKNFSVQNPGANFTINIQNGEGKRGRISSAVVKLNGAVVIGPNDFNKQVDLITKAVQLSEQNTLSIEVRSSPGSFVLVTILSDTPPVSPIGGVTVNPDALFINEPAVVTIRAVIPYDPAGGTPPATLQRVDNSGNVLATEGSLTDDGNLSNGDEIKGDGIFSLRKVFSSAQAERIRLRIALQQGVLVINSKVFFLDVFAHLTDAELNAIKTLQANAEQFYKNFVGSKQDARNATLALITQDPNVLQAGLSENGNGIWILYKSGVLGGVMLNPANTKGGGGGAAWPFGPVINPYAALFSQPLLLQGGDNRIKNRKAIVLSPFLFDFGAADEGDEIKQLLEDSACPAYDVTNLTDAAVTVNTVKTLNQFGVVAISSHGDTFYNGILSFWTDQFGWNFFGAQVVFLTGEAVTNANKVANEIDLKKGRLAITNSGTSHYAILPSFIEHYSGGGYPNSLIYMSSCRSTFNNSMSNAFLGKGAATYLGYSEYVDAAFANQAGVSFFTIFLGDPPETTGDSFVPGQSDSGNPPAFFQMRGSSTLKTPSAELLEGGFEAGNLGAWKASGDGRVVPQLGQFSPTEGAFAGLISTGLGFTINSGSIQQEVCLPSDAKQLQFDWNFSSAEFVEFCGSIFQDFFKVEIITDSGTHVLFFRKVDDLCPTVFQTSLVFDRADVWSTGWQSQSIDISAIAAANQGKSVTIRFSAGDVGDSIFDTAILLDKIKIVQ